MPISANPKLESFGKMSAHKMKFINYQFKEKCSGNLKPPNINCQNDWNFHFSRWQHSDALTIWINHSLIKHTKYTSTWRKKHSTQNSSIHSIPNDMTHSPINTSKDSLQSNQIRLISRTYIFEVDWCVKSCLIFPPLTKYHTTPWRPSAVMNIRYLSSSSSLFFPFRSISFDEQFPFN